MRHSSRLLWGAASVMLMVLAVAACVAPAIPATPAQTDATAMPEDSGVSRYKTWDDVLAAAKGTTVNWFMWGGSDNINTQVDKNIGGPLKDNYDIMLNRIPVDNTADAVNKVLNEKAAGKNTGGSIDAIWINAENFRTLKDARLLYGPFTNLLPNSKYVNWKDPSVAYDFGVPVEGYESPWASFQFVMEYNTATVGKEPPRTWEALQTWIQNHPGRFTYPAPPNHVGSAFVRMLFYWAAGDSKPFLGKFDQAVYDQYAPKVWAYLNAIKPNLWRNGETYPELAPMADLLANQEIDFAMEYDANRASNYILQGHYPDTIRTFVFDTGTVANISYIGIPYNASNPAGAMVLDNFLLSPDYQIAMTDPAKLGWMVAIDPQRLSTDDQARLQATPRGVATLPPDVLRSHALPEMSADWVTRIDSGWADNVLK